MIHESWPWRRELLRSADRLEKRASQRRWLAQTSVSVERDIMLGAYAVRRLVEASKVTRKTAETRFPVRRFDLIDAMPDARNRHDLEVLFDLEHGSEATLTTARLCNQIVHSWIFTISAPETGYGMDGIYVSSDKARREHLYFVPLTSLLELFRSVGEEQIVSITMRYDSRGEAYWTGLIAPRDAAPTSAEPSEP